MALSKDTPQVWELGEINQLPVAASTKVYEGSALGDNGSGYVRPLTAGDPFRGFSLQNVDNSAGAAGDKSVQFRDEGKVKLAVSGAAITDVGKAVYASDDGTFTLTATSNSFVGRIYRWVSTGVVIVKYDVGEVRGYVAPLTSAAGTAAAGTVDVGSSFSQSTLNNNFATLVAAINALAASTK